MVMLRWLRTDRAYPWKRPRPVGVDADLRHIAKRARLADMDKPYASFAEFYPFYLGEHANRTCRRLHFVGSTLVLLVLALVLARLLSPWALLSLPVLGYGFAWVGHFFFEKNRPATFSHPFYSFLGDWVMYRDLLTGRIPF
jgi:hypothetical protein